MEIINQTEIETNLTEVRDEIRHYCKLFGREEGSVRLLAVSKTHPVEAVIAAAACGQIDFAENRIQELTAKISQMASLSPDLAARCKWHQIGTVQKNKLKYLIGNDVLIHSVHDSGLLQEISKLSTRNGVTSEILIQTNISGEESKQGFAAQALADTVALALKLPGIKIRGLMTMAPFYEDPSLSLPIFQECRFHFEQIQSMLGPDFDTLSMGMSQDFPYAIQAGATMLRIGSRIFGKREYSK